MRARLIEAFDTASGTEKMLGLLAAEAVNAERISSVFQHKIGMWNEQVEVARCCTDRAIAVKHLGPWR